MLFAVLPDNFLASCQSARQMSQTLLLGRLFLVLINKSIISFLLITIINIYKLVEVKVCLKKLIIFLETLPVIWLTLSQMSIL